MRPCCPLFFERLQELIRLRSSPSISLMSNYSYERHLDTELSVYLGANRSVKRAGREGLKINRVPEDLLTPPDLKQALRVRSSALQVLRSCRFLFWEYH